MFVTQGTHRLHVSTSRSQEPRGLRRRSTASRLLRSWVRIPPGAWMFVCCECCVLSSRGLCDGLITRPEESYRLWCIVVCDLEASNFRRPWSALGCSATGNNKNNNITYFDYWTVIFTPILYRLSHGMLCTHWDHSVFTSVKYLSQIICLEK